jgi:hypothetical protein
MLVERNGVLGGVATAGLMANIGNLFLDREGRHVIRGLPREVVDRLVARGAASAAWASREVPGIVIDAEALKVVLAELQREAGVQVLTHTLAARPIVDNGTVRGAYVESKMGRQAVLADVVVDATGEADLAWQAGCPMRWTDGSSSLEFKMAGVDLEALYQHFRRQPHTFPVGMDMVKGYAEFERNWLQRGIFFFPHGGGRAWDIFQRAVAEGVYAERDGILYDLHAAGLYGLRGQEWVIVNSMFWRVDTLDPRRTSEAELECQAACERVATFFRQHVPGFAEGYIASIASDLGIRVSRGIEGHATITSEQASSPRPATSAQAVACAPCRADYGRVGEFFYPHSFDVPYGVLLPRGVSNLLVASGKSISAQPQGLLRGMSTCMLLGQSAGVAAAVASRSGVAPAELPIALLQGSLLDQSVYLGEPERLARLGLRGANNTGGTA